MLKVIKTRIMLKQSSIQANIQNNNIFHSIIIKSTKKEPNKLKKRREEFRQYLSKYQNKNKNTEICLKLILCAIHIKID